MENITFVNGSDITESQVKKVDVRIEALSHIYWRVAEALNKVYFPILVPVGIVGNILSFLVMIQAHNRHMSISLYIAALAVTDSATLLVGFVKYLNVELGVIEFKDYMSFCKGFIWIFFSVSISSNLIIVFMTFERFYSIIRPHKAASFNTVKRAKITIVCILIFCFAYNIPHLFLTSFEGLICITYGLHSKAWYNRFFYWSSFVVQFVFPFTALLGMNSTIIHILRTRIKSGILRSESQGQGHGQGHGKGEGQSGKMKRSERQIVMILLLVAFCFCIFTTPGYAMLFYVSTYDYTKSAQDFAGYYLFFNVGQKATYTNYGINFFLYVMSGRKFRTDLMRLFIRKQNFVPEMFKSKTEKTNISGSIETDP